MSVRLADPNSEPTEQDLDMLMKDVLDVAIHKSKLAHEAFFEQIKLDTQRPRPRAKRIRKLKS